MSSRPAPAPCAASRAVERGTRFLLANQGADGLWRDFRTPAGEASEWPTGFIGASLHLAGVGAGAVERAAAALRASQNDDGGWGYHEGVPTDADSTAWGLLLLLLLGDGDDACRRAATCLVRHQRADGGGIATFADPDPIRRFMGLRRWVGFGGWCRPHLEVTAVAGRTLALLLTAGAPQRDAEAAWRYVRSQQTYDGSWAPYWWTSSHYSTLQAAELAAAFGDHDAVSRAADWALRSQNDDGGWSAPGAPTSAFATANSLSLLVLGGAQREAIARATDGLAALQQDDGGWPGHPILRIPLPGDRDPDGRGRWRPIRFGSGIVVADQHRTFTSAACVAALARTGTDAGHP